MRRALASLAAAGILMSTACGVQADAHYSDAESLRSALEGEGFRCTEAATSSTLEGYGEELRCEEGMSITVWEEDIPDYVDDPGMLFMIGGQLTGQHYLVSETWALGSSNAEMLEEIAETFGGETVAPNEDLREIMETYG